MNGTSFQTQASPDLNVQGGHRECAEVINKHYGTRQVGCTADFCASKCAPCPSRFGTPRRCLGHCTSTFRHCSPSRTDMGCTSCSFEMQAVCCHCKPFSEALVRSFVEQRVFRCTRSVFSSHVASMAFADDPEADATWRTKDTNELGDRFLKDSSGHCTKVNRKALFSSEFSTIQSRSNAGSIFCSSCWKCFVLRFRT